MVIQSPRSSCGKAEIMTSELRKVSTKDIGTPACETKTRFLASTPVVATGVVSFR
jgi:hypothetical protein